MNRKYDYDIGKVYGLKRLDALEYINGHTVAFVSCVLCGKQSVVRPSSLFRSKNTSCTCVTKSVDGESGSRLYGIYHNMKYRCATETANEYDNYGARGIKVCSEWLGKDGYLAFKDWALNNGYEDNLTIDRIDPDKGYCPENCQWVTKSENTSRANSSKRTQHRKSDNGRYYATDSNGVYYEFDNACLFAEQHNIVARNLRKHARNGKPLNGWKFGYIDNLQIAPQSTIESLDSPEQVEYIAGETPAVEAPSTT